MTGTATTARKRRRATKRPSKVEHRPLNEAARMRVAIYTRISTDEDNQPFSLEAQRDRLTPTSTHKRTGRSSATTRI